MKKLVLLSLFVIIITGLFAEDPVNFYARYVGNGNCWEISFVLTEIQTEELAIWYPFEEGVYRKIRVLSHETLKPGNYCFYWDGKDDSGNSVDYKIGQNAIYRNRKVLLLK
jgi:hypothetical protein